MNDDDFFGGVFVALVFAALAFLLGHFFGWQSALRTVHTEAVKANHAIWVANPDGTTTFRWRDVKEASK